LDSALDSILSLHYRVEIKIYSAVINIATLVYPSNYYAYKNTHNFHHDDITRIISPKKLEFIPVFIENS
jgi:hypothetical protein